MRTECDDLRHLFGCEDAAQGPGQHANLGVAMGSKKAAVVFSAGVHGPGRGPEVGPDFQATFFRDWLEWAGVTDVTEAPGRASQPMISTSLARSHGCRSSGEGVLSYVSRRAVASAGVHACRRDARPAKHGQLRAGESGGGRQSPWASR